MPRHACPLCEQAGGALVVQTPQWRVIRAAEAGFPAFYRLVWADHVAEFSDLTPDQRHLCMDAVAQVETLLRQHLHPAKVNLASLGNAVPHLHWHIIARFEWDSHFPAPVWAPAQRETPGEEVARIESLLPALEKAMTLALAHPSQA
jgi:diadenosine tetraphosphate (Ap4A) HIT family hydrolase